MREHGQPVATAGQTEREAAVSSDELLVERSGVVRRTLRALPDEMLSALDRGLERSSDRLIVGRLFKSRSGGGCAVGVMLQELHPELRSQSRMGFVIKSAWRLGSGSFGGALARNRRLRHLEWSFDLAVERLRELYPGLSGREAAGTVGRWFRAEAQRELDLRRLERQPLGSGRPLSSPAREHCAAGGGL
jgi:hypothetical protein